MIIATRYSIYSAWFLYIVISTCSLRNIIFATCGQMIELYLLYIHCVVFNKITDKII